MEKPASLRRIGKTTEKTAFEPLPGSSSTFRKVYGQASSQKPLSPDVQEDNFVATTCLSDILLSASKEINNSIDQYVKDQRKEEHDYQYTSSESQPEEVASATLDKETSSSPQRFSDGDLSEFLNFLAKEQLLDVLQHVVTKLLEQLISASTARGGSVSDLSYGSSSDGSNPSRPGGNSLDFLRFLTKETSLSEMLSSQLSGFSGGISPMNSSDIMSRKWPLPGPYDRTKGYSTSSSDLKSENWYQNNSGQYRAKREKPKGMCNQFPPLPSKVKSSKPLKKELDPLQIQEIKNDHDFPNGGESSSRIPDYSGCNQTSSEDQLQTPEEITSIFEDALSLMILRDRAHQKLSEKIGFSVDVPLCLKKANVRDTDGCPPRKESKNRTHLSKLDDYFLIHHLSGHKKRCLAAYPQWACSQKTTRVPRPRPQKANKSSKHQYTGDPASCGSRTQDS